MYRFGLFLLLILFVGCGNQSEITKTDSSASFKSYKIVTESETQDQLTVDNLKRLIEQNAINMTKVKCITSDDLTWLNVVSIKHYWENLQTWLGTDETVNGQRHFLRRKNKVVFLGDLVDIKLIDNELFYLYRYGMGKNDLVLGCAKVVNDDLVVTETRSIQEYIVD